MEKLIKNILNDNLIYEYSFCSFAAVENYLLPCRAASRLPKNSKTIIMVAFPYKVKNRPPANISRYAAVPDYHLVCGKFLNDAANALKAQFPQNEFAVFLDNSPIPEVYAAAYSGLGVKGLNGLLIHKTYGSYVFLGEIVTDLELPTAKFDQKCLECSQCIKHCNSVTNKKECLSAVNQQKNGLTKAQEAQIKASGLCWGCDVCSEVCPMNKNTQTTYIPEFINGYRECYSPTEDPKDRAYNWRGPGVIKRNYNLINE